MGISHILDNEWHPHAFVAFSLVLVPALTCLDMPLPCCACEGSRVANAFEQKQMMKATSEHEGGNSGSFTVMAMASNLIAMASNLRSM